MFYFSVLCEKNRKLQKCRNYWYIFVMTVLCLGNILKIITKNSFLGQIYAFLQNTVL
ncbi:hypothetical protein KM92DES2_10186 [uncultured Desulfovibrio sp.]|uniref:Uncharacterized protein n=1 Tax=uncultured Desulfovibrio sp. TaxID=167968 RepID=A0A212IX69_9BACT|nr:hypothetical protein KM92DES2_10186 [uncultured Desulfovibrio sp.]